MTYFCWGEKLLFPLFNSFSLLGIMLGYNRISFKKEGGEKMTKGNAIKRIKWEVLRRIQTDINNLEEYNLSVIPQSKSEQLSHIMKLVDMMEEAEDYYEYKKYMIDLTIQLIAMWQADKVSLFEETRSNFTGKQDTNENICKYVISTIWDEVIS